MTSGPDRRDTSSAPPLVRSILIEIAIVLVLAISFFLAMRIANRRLGLRDPTSSTEETAVSSGQADSLTVPEMAPRAGEQERAESPEATWETTPCSLFTSASSGARIIDLPQAPDGARIPYEALLVTKAWAVACGMDEDDLLRVFVFNRADTIYVDLPEHLDTEGLRRTLEGRFVCFTRMFVLIGGNPAGDPAGVPLRGVAGGIPD